MAVRVWFDLPRDARWVASVRDVAGTLLQTAGTPDADVADVQLALTEACANVVRHAVGTDSYRVGLAIDPAGCEVEIVDHGPGFEEGAAGDSTNYAESGRGLDLMRALVDDLEVRTDPGTTRLVLRKWSSAGLGPAMVATGDTDAMTVGGDGLAAGDQAHAPADRGPADVSQRVRRSRPFRPGEIDPYPSRRPDPHPSRRPDPHPSRRPDPHPSRRPDPHPSRRPDPAWAIPYDGRSPARVPSGQMGADSSRDVRHRQPRAVETDPSA